MLYQHKVAGHNVCKPQGKHKWKNIYFTFILLFLNKSKITYNSEKSEGSEKIMLET